MKVEPTVLVVSSGDRASELEAALEREGVFVERAGPASFGELLPVVAPDLVLALGATHALPILERLRTTDRTGRARLAVIADREAQSTLRELDRDLLVSILSSDVPVAALATRLATVARRLAERAAAERASSRPPPVVTTTSASNMRSLSSLLRPTGVLGEVKKGLSSLGAANPARRGSLSSDQLKAVPLPDLSLPQRADASKWRRSGRAHRVVVADDDVTRGAAVGQALMARGLEVQVVPLDPARTRWAQLQAHSPDVLIVDEVGTVDHRRVWLELFSADRVLSSARVVKVDLRALFDERSLEVSLKPLEKHIEGLAAWRHEMPTIIDDEERPTLVGGEEGGPHTDEFDPGFDDRPTMARAPAGEVDKPVARAPSYGPPSVQLTESIIAESKNFFAASPAAALPTQPLPTQSSHPPRPVATPPAPTSWRPVAAAPTPPPPPATVPVPQAPASMRAPLAPATLAGPSARPRPAPKGKSLGLLWGVLGLLGLGGVGFALWQRSHDGLGPSAPSARSASDGPSEAKPAEADGSTPARGAADDGARTSAAASAESLWVLGPGDAKPCDQVAEPPADVTALTLAAGSRAWEKARDLLVLGDMQGAQKQMCTAVFNHPQSLALEGLAGLYLTLRTPSEALRWVEQALGVRPGRAKTLELYGDVLVMLGREADAKKAWLSGLKVPADDAKTLQLLSGNLTEEADKALRSGDLPRAEQLSRRAAGLDMQSARAAGTMAAVLLAAGQTELADRWTRRCVSLGENEPSCLLAQGDWAMSKGDLKTARLRYEKVTRLAPGDRRAWQKLGGAAPRSDAAGEPEQVAPVDEPAVEPTPAPTPAPEPATE